MKTKTKIVKIFCAGFFICISASSIGAGKVFATLSCSFTTAAACTSPSAVILRMASSSNSHSELPSMSNVAYSNNVLCCAGVTGISNSCTATSTTVLKLASTSNSHVEENTFLDFPNNACISAPTGTFTIGYQANNCSGYDTSLGSLASAAGTNSHIGTSTAYTTQICGKYAPSQSISFTLSTTSLGFGNLSSAAARYATSDGSGSTTSTAGNTITVSANSTNGYNLFVSGATLTSVASSSVTIAAIGGTNTASAPGTEQFGINVTASGGTGAVSSPYSGSGFAYNATSSSAVIGSESTGDGVNTIYSITYLANIKGSTKSQSYSTVITYQVTGNF